MSENAIDLTPQEIDSIKAQMIASDDALVMSEFFKALSDPTRLNMVHALLLHKWLCVSDIASLVELSKSAVSHQLAYMRINKLVRVKREGRKVFYALNDSHVESVLLWLYPTSKNNFSLCQNLYILIMPQLLQLTSV